MADVFEFQSKQTKPDPAYSVDVTLASDQLLFTVKGIKVNPESLYKVADELEKIARIIRTDVMTGDVN